MSHPLRVAIVDDHEFIVEVLTRTLAAREDLTLALACPSGRDALGLVDDERVDVVLLDQNLRGDLDGLETMLALRAQGLRAPCLFFAAGSDDDFADRVLDAGAAGCLSKRSRPDAVCDALVRVARGEQVVDV